MKKILAVPISLLTLVSAAQAQTNPLLGNWQIVGAIPAPWITPDKISSTIKEGNVRRFVKQKVAFSAKEVKSRDPLIALQAKNNLVATRGKPVALLGVEGLAVVDSGDAILVCRRDCAQDVRAVVSALEGAGLGDLR